MNPQHSPGGRGKILVAKVGLDGHDRGAKILTRLLCDEGFEVVYLGLRNTAEQVASAALQESVEVVAVSILSGAHLEVAGAVRRALDAEGLSHVPIAMGGLVPHHDAEALHSLGVARCFHPGQDSGAPAPIAEAIAALVAQSRRAAESVTP